MRTTCPWEKMVNCKDFALFRCGVGRDWTITLKRLIEIFSSMDHFMDYFIVLVVIFEVSKLFTLISWFSIDKRNSHCLKTTWGWVRKKGTFSFSGKLFPHRCTHAYCICVYNSVIGMCVLSFVTIIILPKILGQFHCLHSASESNIQ